jgi:hypothetical protein
VVSVHHKALQCSTELNRPNQTRSNHIISNHIRSVCSTQLYYKLMTLLHLRYLAPQRAKDAVKGASDAMKSAVSGLKGDALRTQRALFISSAATIASPTSTSCFLFSSASSLHFILHSHSVRLTILFSSLSPLHQTAFSLR